MSPKEESETLKLLNQWFERHRGRRAAMNLDERKLLNDTDELLHRQQPREELPTPPPARESHGRRRG